MARGGAEGRIAVESEAPLNENNHNFLRLYVGKPGEGGFGLTAQRRGAGIDA